MTDPLATCVMFTFAVPLVATGDITYCPLYNFEKLLLETSSFLTPNNLTF